MSMAKDVTPLRRFRDEHGLTQAQMCAHLKVSDASLRSHEQMSILPALWVYALAGLSLALRGNRA